MSGLALLAKKSADSGQNAACCQRELTHITRARTGGGRRSIRDTISKSTRVGSPTTQAPLREQAEVTNTVRGSAATTQQAFAWYRPPPLPNFGDQLAEALVKDGGAEAVKRHPVKWTLAATLAAGDRVESKLYLRRKMHKTQIPPNLRGPRDFV
jgi:hypothetical protein